MAVVVLLVRVVAVEVVLAIVVANVMAHVAAPVVLDVLADVQVVLYSEYIDSEIKLYHKNG